MKEFLIILSLVMIGLCIAKLAKAIVIKVIRYRKDKNEI